MDLRWKINKDVWIPAYFLDYSGSDVLQTVIPLGIMPIRQNKLLRHVSGDLSYGANFTVIKAYKSLKLSVTMDYGYSLSSNSRSKIRFTSYRINKEISTIFPYEVLLKSFVRFAGRKNIIIHNGLLIEINLDSFEATLIAVEVHNKKNDALELWVNKDISSAINRQLKEIFQEYPGTKVNVDFESNELWHKLSPEGCPRLISAQRKFLFNKLKEGLSNDII